MADAHVTLKRQHPLATLDHTITVRGLATNETLSGTPTVTAAAGLTVGSNPAPAISGTNAVVFWLSGGTAGQTYQGEIVVGTNQSRTPVITWEIEIIDLSPAVEAS